MQAAAPVRVLLVDDDEDEFVITRALLAEARNGRFELEWVGAFEAGLAAILEARHAVYLVDYRLGERFGIDLLRQAVAQGCKAPIIMLTGQGDQEVDLEAMRAGAADYLEKSQLTAALLERAVRYALERAHAMETLRHSEERYRMLFESNPQPMWVYDRETLRFLAVNQAAVEHYGYPRQEFLDLSLMDLHLPEAMPALLEAVQTNTGPVRNSGPWRHRKKDGALLHAQVTTFDLRFDGHPGRLVLINDVTERRQAEERISELLHLLDQGRDAIMVCDLADRILYFNKGAEHLFGWTTGEALGRAVSDLFPPQAAELLAAQKLVRETGAWDGELCLAAKNGEAVALSSRWTLARDTAGQPKSTLIISTDITEKKRLETQFLRSQRLEAIGTLASGVAHDLNNILAPIVLAAPMLRSSLPPEEAAELLTTIEESAQRGADIVRQLLILGRGRETRRSSVQLRDVIQGLTRMLRETFPALIDLHEEIAPDLWPVLGDDTQLHQVLLNLCVNARDAMAGEGVLTIAARNLALEERVAARHPGAKPGPHVLLQVTDTGQGIAPDILTKIFDPFFTTKEPGKGTGLGLSTVQGIVRNHAGFVSVQSLLGKGSTFAIYLPATPAAAPCPAATPAATPARGNGEVVLVVDDEPNLRLSLQRILTHHGYRVLVAEDGASALLEYSRHRDDVKAIVTDLMMPVMDGTTLIQMLQRLAPKVPVIVSSGVTSDPKTGSNLTKLEALGVRACLTKPYNAATLLTAVQQVLAN